jgi:hypothetical protein
VTSTGSGAENRQVVFSLHGIRTRGAWQKSLNRALTEAGFIHVPLDYGFFSAVSLLRKGKRRRQIDWFRDEYADHVKQDGPTPCVIAHSMGSYLIARAMQIYRDVSFDKVILCGSIIQRDYPWSDRIRRNQCQLVLHDYGRLDIWARIAEWAIEDAGASGTGGFTDLADGKVIQRAHPEFRHSDYFHDLNYRKNWIPFLRGLRPDEITDADRPSANWKFKVTRLLFIGALLALLAFGLWLIRGCVAEPNGAPSLDFPSDVTSAVPPRSVVLAEPAVPPEDVDLTYRNESEHDIELLFYSCYLHYEPGNPPREPWYKVPLAAGRERNPTFTKPSGWYLLYVRENGASDWTYVGRFDFYSYKRGLLTIQAGKWWRPGDPEYIAHYENLE